MSAPPSQHGEELLAVRQLRVAFAHGRSLLPAVDGIDLRLAAGETLALLGESGCGKSATALALLRLLPAAGRIVAGEVCFGGRDLLRLPESEMRAVRGGGMAMIFQEPATSLNPVLTVGRQLAEVLARHRALGGAAAQATALELLLAVGIADAPRRLGEYPFQLSGGMKQRVMIAMALAGEPRLLIADEPTTALDVTIQAQILELLRRLQAERAMGMLLITHDLGVVAQMATRVGVMYAGEIVEEAPRAAFFSAPRHPYTQKLFAALPDLARRGGQLADDSRAGAVAVGDAGRLPLCCPLRARLGVVPAAVAAVAAGGDRSSRALPPRRRRGVARCETVAAPPPVAKQSPSSRRHRRCWRWMICGCISRSGAASCSAPSAMCGRWTASRWRWRVAARWRWSASRAAARRRSARRSCNCCRPVVAACACSASNSAVVRAAHSGRCGGTCR
jgi:ABC-type dipeptide/oligopeptide/nickel transport system ATPase component